MLNYCAPLPLWAGMPVIRLSDVVQMRLQEVSFFLFVFLLSIFVVRALWNSLQQDFTKLPRLTYQQSAALVLLWGLLFVVVLTMISGARELMTPGAWERRGATYKLKEQAAPVSRSDGQAGLLERRREKLWQLRGRLLQFAASHDGRFPTSAEAQSWPDAEVWDLPQFPGTKYVYVSGQTLSNRPALLAYEPNVFPDDPLALLDNGEIVQWKMEVLTKLAPQSQPPAEARP